jgi:hypothetical protein
MHIQVENPKKTWIEPQIKVIPIETLNPFGFLNEIEGSPGS